MRKAVIHFFCGIAALCAAFWIGSAAWESGNLLPGNLPDKDYTAEIGHLMEEKRFEEAELLCCDVIGMGLPGSENANIQLRRCREEKGSWNAGALDALKGFATGHGDNSAALAGAAASDLFIYGDVRDLGIQFYRKLRGLPVDSVIVALFSVGLAVELTGFVDSVPALMKMLHRAGALSTSLMDHCRSALQSIKKHGRLSHGESKFFRNLNRIVQQHGMARSGILLRSIKTPEELEAAVRIGEKSPEVPFLIAHSAPEEGGALLLRFSDSQELLTLLKQAARKGSAGTEMLKKIKFVKFTLKNLYQGRFREIMICEGIKNPSVRRWLWGSAFLFLLTGLFFLSGNIISVGRALLKMRAICSRSADVPRSSPGGNVPDNSNSGCSCQDQTPEDPCL